MRQLWPQDDVSRDLNDADLYDAYATPTHQRRWLRTNMVASADGAATIAGRVGELTTPADQRLLLLLRAMCDVLLIGAGTLRAEGYDSLGLTAQHLAWRRTRGLTQHPVLAVVSGRLDLSPSSPALVGSRARPIVITHSHSPRRRRAEMETVADVIVAGSDDVDLVAALNALEERGLRHTLCEGGPRLLGSLGATGLVDEFCLTVSPLLAGTGATRIVTGQVHEPRHMQLGHVLTADGVLMLRYITCSTTTRENTDLNR